MDPHFVDKNNVGAEIRHSVSLEQKWAGSQPKKKRIERDMSYEGLAVGTNLLRRLGNDPSKNIYLFF